MLNTYGRRLLLMKILESKDVISRTLRVAGRRPKIFRIFVFAYSVEKSFCTRKIAATFTFKSASIVLDLTCHQIDPNSSRPQSPPNPPGIPPILGRSQLFSENMGPPRLPPKHPKVPPTLGGSARVGKVPPERF